MFLYKIINLYGIIFIVRMCNMVNVFFKTTSVAFVSLIFGVLIQVLFLFKGKTNRTAGKLFFILTIITVLSTVINIILGYVAVNGLAGKVFLTRLHIFVLLEWFYMAIYHFSAAFINEQEFRDRTKKFKKSIIISSAIFSILNIVFSIFLPIEYASLEGGGTFMLGGLLYWYLLAWVLCLIICSLFYMFQYKKKLEYF